MFFFSFLDIFQPKCLNANPIINHRRRDARIGINSGRRSRSSRRIQVGGGGWRCDETLKYELFHAARRKACQIAIDAASARSRCTTARWRNMARPENMATFSSPLSNNSACCASACIAFATPATRRMPAANDTSLLIHLMIFNYYQLIRYKD